MKNVLLTTLLLFAFAALPSQASAASATQRAHARAQAECTQQAMQMGLRKKTIRRVNFIKDCMIDRGFQG